MSTTYLPECQPEQLVDCWGTDVSSTTGEMFGWFAYYPSKGDGGVEYMDFVVPEGLELVALWVNSEKFDWGAEYEPIAGWEPVESLPAEPFVKGAVTEPVLEVPSEPVAAAPVAEPVVAAPVEPVTVTVPVPVPVPFTVTETVTVASPPEVIEVPGVVVPDMSPALVLPSVSLVFAGVAVLVKGLPLMRRR